MSSWDVRAMERSDPMREGTWQDYGTPETQALGHEDIEQAIARLERLWDDARARAQDDTVGVSPDPYECRDCCAS